MTLIINDSGEIDRSWIRSPSGLILTEDAARLRYAAPRHPQAGDLFAGCGGASLGFKQAGFQVRFAVEWEVIPAIVYMANLGTYPCTMHVENEERQAKLENELSRYMKTDEKTGLITMSFRSGISGVMNNLSVPGTDHMWVWDASKLTGEMLLDPLGMKPGELDALHGSPPCQGVSNAGKKDPNDKRNLLMLEYARLITEIRPKCFTMEQVPNVVNMTLSDGQPILDAFLDIIERGDYAPRKALEKMIRLQGGEHMLLHRTKGTTGYKTGPRDRKSKAKHRAPKQLELTA